ncbi:unnamed protein product [Oppiella nova]|uniref:PWWP domain-containing protein n=1 Tax=Oppiella nova TaxID=334625 RepID=A0A7R9M570_9ACAR|nr:unnamed protein product [Oppiella nova]CAG2169689.1 unnamed protein product [Oppiella nova]
MPPKTPRTYSVGDLVFAKVKGYPPWPARVESEPPPGYRAGPGRYPVFFFGTYESAVVAARDLSPYEQTKHKLGTPRKLKDFNKGLEEIEKDPELTVGAAEPADNQPDEEEAADEELEAEDEPMDESADQSTADKPAAHDGDNEDQLANGQAVKKESEGTVTGDAVVSAGTSAADEPMGSDSDSDEDKKLIIDDRIHSPKKASKVSAGSKKSTKKESSSSTASASKSSSKKSKSKESDSKSSAGRKRKSSASEKSGAGRKRRRVILESSSDESDGNKADEESGADSQRASADEKRVTAATSEDKESDEESEPKKNRKSRQKKEKPAKSSGKASKLEESSKKRRKESKAKDKEAVESAPTSGGEAPVADDPEVVEKVRLKLQESKDEIQQKLQEKEREKERRKQEKKEQKRKEKAEKSGVATATGAVAPAPAVTPKAPPTVAEVLASIDSDIQTSLSRESANVDKCLEAMERLKGVSVTPEGLQTYGQALKALIVTLKKCRKYKTDERVRQKSDHLYHKFKDFFYTTDTAELTDSSSALNNTGADTNSTDTSGDSKDDKTDTIATTEAVVKSDDNQTNVDAIDAKEPSLSVTSDTTTPETTGPSVGDSGIESGTTAATVAELPASNGHPESELTAPIDDQQEVSDSAPVDKVDSNKAQVTVSGDQPLSAGIASDDTKNGIDASLTSDAIDDQTTAPVAVVEPPLQSTKDSSNTTTTTEPPVPTETIASNAT